MTQTDISASENGTQFGHPKGSAEWGRELVARRQLQTVYCEECSAPIPNATKRRKFCNTTCRQRHFQRGGPQTIVTQKSAEP